MKSYPLNEARADFSKLIDRALAGEPQRVTRYGRDAVVVVSEADWQAQQETLRQARTGGTATLGALLARYAETGDLADATARPWAERKLGADFE